MVAVQSCTPGPSNPAPTQGPTAPQATFINPPSRASFAQLAAARQWSAVNSTTGNKRQASAEYPEPNKKRQVNGGLQGTPGNANINYAALQESNRHMNPILNTIRTGTNLCSDYMQKNPFRAMELLTQSQHLVISITRSSFQELIESNARLNDKSAKLEEEKRKADEEVRKADETIKVLEGQVRWYEAEAEGYKGKEYRREEGDWQCEEHSDASTYNSDRGSTVSNEASEPGETEQTGKVSHSIRVLRSSVAHQASVQTED